MGEDTASSQLGASSDRTLIAIQICAETGSPASEEPAWDGEHPLVAMISDIIGACGAIDVRATGSTLFCGFSNLCGAITTARRLQSAVSGFELADVAAQLSVAMLLHSLTGEDSPDIPASLLSVLVGAAPNQVMVGAKTGAQLGNVPGIRLQPSTLGTHFELGWLAHDPPPTVASDDQLLSSLLEQRGLEEPQRVEEDEYKADIEAAVSTRIAMSRLVDAWQQASHLYGSTLLKPWAAPRLMLAGAGLIVGLAGIASFVSLHHSTPLPPVKSSSPNPAQSVPSDLGDRRPQVQVETKSAATRPVVRGSKLEPQKAQGKRNDNCRLNNEEIPVQLENADHFFQRSLYEESMRKYQAILDCNPQDASARRGLMRAQQARRIHGNTKIP